MIGLLRVLGMALWTFAGPIVGRILKALGFGLVAFAGATLAVNQAENYIFAQYNGLPSALWSILTIMGIDLGIKYVFAAYIARIGMQTLFASRSIWNAPPGSSSGSGTIQL